MTLINTASTSSYKINNYHTFSMVEFSPPRKDSNGGEEIMKRGRGRPKKGDSSNNYSSNRMIVTKTETLEKWKVSNKKGITKKPPKRKKEKKVLETKPETLQTNQNSSQLMNKSNFNRNHTRVVRTSISIKELLN
ncbi:predicted protein [Naegleria gruberi]|uniref:Predicted protein n=1 Tax=Naegleria gruberi TaxID=5762 RepID=D2W4I6_NAEGR|nr:uncharacterized protein NAEGRDRAFT_76321 [Naegleria gruberi]EFC36017.1 predicted protein [Naegleria gruberi]|eukprot:XP_002668761.1 predicted protein [Naegleria gruberi strain NEG-M]